MDNLLEDTEHWQNLKPPLSPNIEEVEIYKNQVKGMQPICLLGMTKELIPMCDYMVDLNPIKTSKKVIQCDWLNLEECSEAIIGDGVINLAGMRLVNSMRKICRKLVCRVFTKKLPGMKYATNFPDNFPDSRLIIPTQENVVVVVWDGFH